MRLILTALLSALLCAIPAIGQVPGNTTFLTDPDALRTKLNAWRLTLNKMNFVTSPPRAFQSPSPEQKRRTCLLLIDTVSRGLPHPGELSTTAMRVGFLADLASLDNGLVNLIHDLQLVRAMQPPGGQPSTVELEQEHQVGEIRKELQGIYAALSSETFQQLRATDEGRAAEESALSRQPGQILGHVYPADTSQPLANAVVTLESPQSPENDQVQHTAEDGSYAFTGLASGKYWVIAYRRGFAGAVYGMNASQNAWECTISLSPGQKLANADLRLSPQPRITAMNEGTPPAAIPNNEPPSVYGPGLFSPDGKQFAVAATGPGPGYVRVYSMDTHQTEYVVVVPKLVNWNFALRYLTWAGNSLYAHMDPGLGLSLPGGGVPFKVTPTGMQRADVPPECADIPRGHGCAVPMGTPWPSLPPEVSSPGAYFHHLDQSLGHEANSKFIVTADDFNNTQVRLGVQTTDGKDPYVIATGGKDLKSYLFEPDRSVVYYAIPGRYFGAVVAYDLNTRQSQRVALPFTVGLRLLDSRRGPAGTLFAYAVYGPCVPPESPSGENPWILPNKTLPAIQSANVCFVEIADKTGN